MAVTFNIKNNALVRAKKIQHIANSIEDNEYAEKLINAVEIDWNGAVLSDANPSNGGATSQINDTAQLLDLINTMQKEIYVLTAAVIALSQQNS